MRLVSQAAALRTYCSAVPFSSRCRHRRQRSTAERDGRAHRKFGARESENEITTDTRDPKRAGMDDVSRSFASFFFSFERCKKDFVNVSLIRAVRARMKSKPNRVCVVCPLRCALPPLLLSGFCFFGFFVRPALQLLPQPAPPLEITSACIFPPLTALRCFFFALLARPASPSLSLPFRPRPAIRFSLRTNAVRSLRGAQATSAGHCEKCFPMCDMTD